MLKKPWFCTTRQGINQILVNKVFGTAIGVGTIEICTQTYFKSKILFKFKWFKFHLSLSLVAVYMVRQSSYATNNPMPDFLGNIKG